MKILVIQSTKSGVYYHRQYTPHYTWQDSGDEFKGDEIYIVEDEHLNSLIDILSKNRFDIIQYSIGLRVPENAAGFIEFIRYRDPHTKIILDIDDMYYKNRKDVYFSIKNADAITTTCEFLQKWYKDNGADCPSYVIENGIDSKEAQWELKDMKHEHEEYPVFGYLGSTRHEDDLKEMRYDFSARPLYTVVEEYKEILCVDAFGGLGHWMDYAKHYDRVDVSLAPIVNRPFNHSKSALKIIEAGFKKKAVIATKIQPYTRDESLYPAINLIPKRKSWKGVVEGMTKEEARQQGEELYKLVQPYEIRNLNKKRREIYLEIMGL